MNIADTITNIARVLGDSKAVIHNDKVKTYKELEEDTNRIASALLDLNIKAGEGCSCICPIPMNGWLITLGP